MMNTSYQLDQGFTLEKIINHRRCRHPENMKIIIYYECFRQKCGDNLFAIRNFFRLSLFRVMNLII